ncbi:AlpA family phage regulatory protein [Cereibacter sphaeroides]|uniref:helix-turn-helix transcriptional regulator n=1 Tax=Cereibacter sphaeroides TaxID=1063 RepID=UPI000E5BC3F2|nr:AlpA family phage regulatory protein [Cereibacter sphaeroides]RHZ95342.1 AlpA family phage regulatory protein [Cereibacter sphaeroides]
MLMLLYLTDKQVAERYGVSRATIWRWVKTGTFPRPVTFSPGCVRWSEAEVLAWEAKRLAERPEVKPRPSRRR